MVAAEAWDSIWSEVELIVCLTLRTRADRRAAVTKQFEAHGLLKYVTFLEQEPDTDDGKRGCFHAHQRAARLALERGAPHALIFEDDVEFLPNFTVHAGKRILRFVRSSPPGWSIFFLGHFPRAMELTDEQDVVRVRSMDAHAYLLSASGARELCDMQYQGSQVDVQFHYQSSAAFALYPMVAVQRATFSDTECVLRPTDWNLDKLAREESLYKGCVYRKLNNRVLTILGSRLVS